MGPRAALALLLLLAAGLVVPGGAAAKATKYSVDSVKATYAGVASQTACTSPETFIEYRADVSAQLGRPGGRLNLKGHRKPRGGTLEVSGFSGAFTQAGAWRNVDCQSSATLAGGSCDGTRDLPLALRIKFIQTGNQAMRTRFGPFDGSRELGPELTCGPSTYGPGLQGDRNCFGLIKVKRLRKKHVSLSPDVCDAQLVSPEGAALTMAVDLKVKLTRKG